MTDEAPLCRYCHSSEQPLCRPCRCTGSIKYVHQSCLITWLYSTKKSQCELCNYNISFETVSTPEPVSPPSKKMYIFFLFIITMLAGLIWSIVFRYIIDWTCISLIKKISAFDFLGLVMIAFIISVFWKSIAVLKSMMKEDADRLEVDETVIRERSVESVPARFADLFAGDWGDDEDDAFLSRGPPPLDDYDVESVVSTARLNMARFELSLFQVTAPPRRRTTSTTPDILRYQTSAFEDIFERGEGERRRASSMGPLRSSSNTLRPLTPPFNPQTPVYY